MRARLAAVLLFIVGIFSVSATTPCRSAERMPLLAFVGHEGGTGIYVIRADGTGLTRLTTTGCFPALSPDEKRMVYVVEGGVKNSHLYIINTNGSGNQKLRDEAATYIEPVWSPDGTHVAFMSDWYLEENTFNNVFVIKPDGSDMKRLTDFGELALASSMIFEYACIHSLRWSRDSRQITFGSSYGCTSGVVGIDGSGMQFFDIPCGLIDWSPDGRLMCYVRGESGPVEITTSIGGDSRTLTDSGLDVSPAWSPDGSRIAFRRENISRNRDEIFVVEWPGGRLTQLTNDGMMKSDPKWSSDGALLVYEGRKTFEDKPFLYIIDGRTGNVLLKIEGTEPSWAPARSRLS